MTATQHRLDLRLVPLAVAAWLAAAIGQGWGAARIVVVSSALIAGATVTLAHQRRRGGQRSGGEAWIRSAGAVLLVAAGALAVSGLRAGAMQAGPFDELAVDRASVVVEGRLVSDPVARAGRYGDYVSVRLLASRVLGRGRQYQVRAALLVIAEPSWLAVDYGARVRVAGRLAPAAGPDLSAVLVARGAAEPVRAPTLLDDAVAAVRTGIDEAASPLPETERVLVPALVNGDDAGMPQQAVEDFRTTGLTHLLAVSGANVTLVLGFVLVLSRWCGVRGRWLTVVGLVAVVFFVLVARPQPSVLRAAAMGVVAVVGMTAGGRSRGLRALSLAVLALVLADPWLARSVGFLLSVVATGGILLLAPPWAHAMSRWMPRACADAVAVPLAAQVVCTPVVAAISGQVSVVAVMANLLAAPAVGPTTVLGFAGGLAAVAWEPVGHAAGQAAGLSARWIVAVARHGAGLDGAAVQWPVGPAPLAGLTLLCAGQVVLLGRLLRHRWRTLLVGAAVLGYVLHPPDRPGWPPADWRVVMCDVGQGDGLVLDAGGGAAVVVDAGPDPQAIDRCLDRLDVHTVPLVVLTHFHADHVAGLPGVLEGREVAELEVSPLAEPADGAEQVLRLAAAERLPVTVGEVGAVRRVGDVTLQTIGPPAESMHAGGSTGSAGSAPNNASLVVRATVGGLDVLLAGDSEVEEQAAILASGAGLDVDVLKVSHHGSANQDARFVLATQAAVALVSVGDDNDYGHPSGALLGLLAQLGARVYRTDLHGDVAVVERGGGVAVVRQR